MRKDLPAWVTLKLPDAEPKTLTTNRTPHFLRFVVVGTDWTTLDALDQLTDEPKPEERVIVARKEPGEGALHIDSRDKRGRRIGEWFRTVDYRPIFPQPSQEEVRATADWRAWATAAAKREAELNANG